MQTFLPYRDFHLTANALDHKRLGKQRVEVLQLLQARNNPDSRWRNHPVFRMWYSHPVLLAAYGIIMCETWVSKGYNDTTREKILNELKCDIQKKFAVELAATPIENFPFGYQFPLWWHEHPRYNITSEYRGILLEKNFKHYQQFNWSDDPKEKMQYPIFPIEGDIIDNKHKVSVVFMNDCIGNAVIIDDRGIGYMIEHVEKITNSIYHQWRSI